MSVTDVVKPFRSLLAEPSNEAFYNDIVLQLDLRIGQVLVSDPEEKKKVQAAFEEELHKLYDDDVDFTQQNLSLELFLQVLHYSQPLIPVSSIIATWFDLVLRPALRESRLAPSAQEYAKELAVAGLREGDDAGEKVKGFRRRLLDLFLLDALNESFGSDILEWVELNDQQRQKNRLWKRNLEDILVRFGLLTPVPFLDTLLDCFSISTSRLQILILLDSFATHVDFRQVSSHLFHHPLMSHILRSLEMDNSATVCAVGMAFVVKILPFAAINAYTKLTDILPRLFAILGRMLCWKAKSRSAIVNETAYSDLVDYHESESPKVGKELEQLKVRDELQWERLERTFDAAPASAPVPRHFFVFLYYLFPVNLVFFLRGPAAYLAKKSVESPWTVGWSDVLDESLIRTAATSILRSCIMHPSVIWHDVKAELEDSTRFASYDVSRLVGECQLLEHNTAPVNLANASDKPIQPQNSKISSTAQSASFHSVIPNSRDLTKDESDTRTPTMRSLEIASAPSAGSSTFGAALARERRVSLQNIIDASVALKSGSEIEISDKNNKAWPAALFGPIPHTSPASQRNDGGGKPIATAFSSQETSAGQSQLTETIYGLQREVLLLRTELNFELWLKKENLSHVVSMHRDSLQARNTELERHKLHDRLREFRVRLSETQEELHRHREQSQDMKTKHVEWSTTLSSKLNDLRDQKKSWMMEATTLRTSVMDLKARLAAQTHLLADAQKSIFTLETRIKTDAHKVERLRDYEQRIEQHLAMQRMWDKDIITHNEQSKKMMELLSEHKAMKLQVESFEKAQEAMENEARLNRRKIQGLESKLLSYKKASDPPSSTRLDMSSIANARASETAALRTERDALEKENTELRDELDEMRAMVETRQALVNGGQQPEQPDP